MTDALLRVRGITRRFGDRTILSDVDLDVAAGEAVGVVGPNGSGKSTLLRCIVGADEADGGESTLAGRVLDERLPEIRRDLAVVMDDIDFFPDLSVVEHLDLMARAHGQPDAEEIVNGVPRRGRADGGLGARPSTLSSGQRRRLALASAFVRPRLLLVLDEPEARLDVDGVAVARRQALAEKARRSRGAARQPRPVAGRARVRPRRTARVGRRRWLRRRLPRAPRGAGRARGARRDPRLAPQQAELPVGRGALRRLHRPVLPGDDRCDGWQRRPHAAPPRGRHLCRLVQ